MLLTIASLFFDDGKYADAISYNDKVLQIDPNDPVALSNKAACFMELKQYEKALPLLELSLKADNQSGAMFYNKAACLSVLGQSEESLECLEQAISIDPSLAKSAKTDDDFLSIRDLPRFSTIVY